MRGKETRRIENDRQKDTEGVMRRRVLVRVEYSALEGLKDVKA